MKGKIDYWKNGEIPANLFFYNLNNEDLSFLIKDGNPSNEDLEKAWSDIQDEYFELEGNRKASLLITTRNRIALLVLKINICKISVNIALKNNLNEDQINSIISGLSRIKIKVIKDSSLIDQLTLIVEQYIPSWETELEIEKENLKKHVSKEVSNYEEVIESMSDIKDRHLPENMSLRRFSAVKKSAIKINKQRLKQAS
ncbi:hypothetical protein [Aquimarina macrocephali]|uniref:hypothetical protein n=1 Tax=Aquimarina macrocephali TaxID=666563 RepID=UPI003F67AD09